MKLKKAIEKYQRSILVESTRTLYSYSLRSLLAYLGNVAIDRISTDDLRGWRIGLEKLKSASTRNRGKKLSVYTLHRHVRIIRRFFKWLADEGHLDHSPAARLEFPRLPKNEPPKAVSSLDFERMLETAGREAAESPTVDTLRDYAIVRFLAETGCRVGGLVRLTFDDIDLDNQEATLREKGEKVRMASFGKQTAAALRAWYVVRQRQKHGTAVFVGKRGPLGASGIYQILKRLAERAGVEGRFNPHAFRHALARRLLTNKADLGTVAEILGHADVSTTHQFYARWSKEEVKERHKKFGGILDG